MDELEKLEDLYGRVDTAALCRRLGISYARLRRRAKADGRGFQKDADEYITMRQVRSMMKIEHMKIQRFIAAGLPARKISFGKGKRYNVVVSVDELVAWLERHQDMFEARRIEHMALGQEPEWLRAKRRWELVERWIE